MGRLSAIVTIMAAVALFVAPVQAKAWTQWETENGGTICGGPLTNGYCLKYPKDYSYTYKFSSIFRSDFKDNFNSMIGVWNAALYHSPVAGLSTFGLTASATAEGAFICGDSHTLRDPYHIIQGSTNPNKNSSWVDWIHSSVLYNNDINYSDPGSHCTLNHTLLHEQGHPMMGFSHSGVATAVMYPYDNGVALLSADDNYGLAGMYGHL